MSQVCLVPYTVNEVKQVATEVPEGVALMNAPAVWDESRRGQGVVVAVLDTGCQTDHPDLKDRVVGGRNFTADYDGDPEQFEDNNGHGTHVAGTIAAIQNRQGVVGMAPEASLLILKVLQGDGGGSYQGIVDAINYAIQWRGPQGEAVRVISMSLGGPEDSPELHDAIKRAIVANIIVVCAAGNTGKEEKQYPGGYHEVVGVGAVDLQKVLAKFSTMNQEIDVVAPGVEILSTYLGGKYAKLSGTSMATPHVSGALALIINQCEKDFGRMLTEDEIYAQLCKRTVTLGYKKFKEGNGFVDLTFGYTVVAAPLAAPVRRETTEVLY